MIEEKRPGWLAKMQDSSDAQRESLDDVLREYSRKFRQAAPLMELMGVPEDELIKYIRRSIDSGEPIQVEVPPGVVA